MARILHTGKQYVITLSPDIIKAMGWKKGTEILISKMPGKDIVYLEQLRSPKKRG